MSRLNEEYFRNKDIYKKNISKYSWMYFLIFILVIASTVFVIINDFDDLDNDKFGDLIFEQPQNDTILFLESFKIRINKDYFYSPYNKGIYVISQDSTATLIIKKILQKSSSNFSLKNWEQLRSNSDYRYSLSDFSSSISSDIKVQYANLAVIINANKYQGKTYSFSNDTCVYIIEVMSRFSDWDTKQEELLKMVSSFKIK